jgi:hypothetical protein
MKSRMKSHDPSPLAPPAEDEGEAPILCRKLRTKNAFGSPAPGLRDWRHGTSTTAVYWCLRTMECAGPDGALAHPHGCRRGRGCYLPPPGQADDHDRA